MKPDIVTVKQKCQRGEWEVWENGGDIYLRDAQTDETVLLRSKKAAKRGAENG